MDYPKVKPCLDTSEYDLIDELYLPCLKWADRFDRGVGFFTTLSVSYGGMFLADASPAYRGALPVASG